MKLRLSLKSLVISPREAEQMRRRLGKGRKTTRCFRAGEMMEEATKGLQEAQRMLFRSRKAPRDKCVTTPGGFAAGRQLFQTLDIQKNEFGLAFGKYLGAWAQGNLMGELKLGPEMARAAADFTKISDRTRDRFLELVKEADTRRITLEEIDEMDDLVRESGSAFEKIVDATVDACNLDVFDKPLGIPTVIK